MRIISVSAVLPNVSDIGEWLNCKPEVNFIILILNIFQLKKY